MQQRGPPLTPLQSLMDTLFDLSFRLNHTNGDEQSKSVIQSHDHFSREGNQRKVCTYATKSQNMFMNQDYEAIKSLLLLTIEEIRKREGPGWAR